MDKPHLANIARKLRHDETEAEEILWMRLRRKKLGTKFRRQEPIGNYVVDFVNFEKKLIIELDGGKHTSIEAKGNDAIRTEWLESQGFRIIRFWNNDVSSNLEGVVAQIEDAMVKPPSP